MIFCPELCYSIEKFTTGSSSHVALSMENNIFPTKILSRRFIFQDSNYEDGPMNLLFPFLKIYIWDLGLRFGAFFLGSCNPNLV
jgi:hypothetical protein